MKDTLTAVKKIKGEKFAKALRDAEGGILSIPNIAEIVRHAGASAGPLIDHLRSKVIAALDAPMIVSRPWRELLADSGYSVTVVRNSGEQAPFRRYYREGELPCSFNGSAWDWKLIFFAVRNDADKAIPGNTPDREDAYSTSVLRIKISKNAVSMVSRYNHKVSNPDAVFRNDLNAIAPGLREAISIQEKITLTGSGASLPDGFTESNDGRVLKYDYELGGALIGESAYIIAGAMTEVRHPDKIIEGCLMDGRNFLMKPICDGSDTARLSEPWNENLSQLISDGWRLALENARTIVAIRRDGRHVVATLV